MRCFFALLLSQEVKARVIGLLERLRPSSSGIKWVRPEQLHVTLRFFLSLGAPEQATVSKVAQDLCLGASPYEFSVAGVRTFGPRGAVGTIWAGIGDPSGELSRFHGALVADLEANGYMPESRPFSPHLTLGRLREPSWDPALQAKLEREACFEGGTSIADRLQLITSELRPSGPIYRTLGEWSFGGPKGGTASQRITLGC